MPTTPAGDFASNATMPLATHAERHAVGGADPFPQGSIAPAWLTDVPHVEASVVNFETVPSGTEWIISFIDNANSANVITERVENFWNSGTPGNFIIPMPGIYLIAGWIFFSGTGGAGDFRQARIKHYRNSNAQFYTLCTSSSNSWGNHRTVMATALLETNDIIQMFGHQDSGFGVTGSARLSITWLGSFTGAPENHILPG